MSLLVRLILSAALTVAWNFSLYATCPLKVGLCRSPVLTGKFVLKVLAITKTLVYDVDDSSASGSVSVKHAWVACWDARVGLGHVPLWCGFEKLSNHISNHDGGNQECSWVLEYGIIY